MLLLYRVITSGFFANSRGGLALFICSQVFKLTILYVFLGGVYNSTVHAVHINIRYHMCAFAGALGDRKANATGNLNPPGSSTHSGPGPGRQKSGRTSTGPSGCDGCEGRSKILVFYLKKSYFRISPGSLHLVPQERGCLGGLREQVVQDQNGSVAKDGPDQGSPHHRDGPQEDRLPSTKTVLAVS